MLHSHAIAHISINYVFADFQITQWAFQLISFVLARSNTTETTTFIASPEFLAARFFLGLSSATGGRIGKSSSVSLGAGRLYLQAQDVQASPDLLRCSVMKAGATKRVVPHTDSSPPSFTGRARCTAGR